MIYSQNYPLYCKYIIRHILAPILRDLLDWGEKVAGISKLQATLKDRQCNNENTEKTSRQPTLRKIKRGVLPTHLPTQKHHI